MLVPFHTYIIKIASRCNLNCTYCFVYNQADQRWRAQPKLMAAETLQQICRRIVGHCQAHDKHDISLIFHGGEPLLGGVRHLRMLVDTIRAELGGTGIRATIGMQSNGLLFDEEIGDFCLEHGVRVGISIDGPPHINDRHRLDLAGRGSSARLEQRLAVLTKAPYREIFSGFLVVVSLDADPIELFDYLAAFNPPGIDFILPYDNWDRRPAGKEAPEAAPYGEWLCRLFDHWINQDSKIRVREFDSFMRLLVGGESLVESLGAGVVDLVVVETNGELEAVDSLKATFEGATALGFDVFTHDLDAVAEHVGVRSRQLGAASLCQTCKSCPEVAICGGGYVPNRYSAARGFDNPSIYCQDLQRIIAHVRERVVRELQDASTR
jgi:uncharacterized protein